VRDSTDTLHTILRAPSLFARVHRATERDLALGHRNLYIRRIHHRVVAEPVADIFTDTVVRPYIALGATATMPAIDGIHVTPSLRILIAEP
jgi:hypothetical protein